MGCPRGVVGCGHYLTTYEAGPACSPEPLRDAVGSVWVGALSVG